MEEARALISVLRELNETSDRKVAQFTPSLIGLFGSTSMFEDFLSDLDEAFKSGQISKPIKVRAANLAQTFIPQVAKLNGIADLAGQTVSVEQLRTIRIDSADQIKQGVRAILAALIKIMDEVCKIG
jgi:hypothetical protein